MSDCVEAAMGCGYTVEQFLFGMALAIVLPVILGVCFAVALRIDDRRS